MTLDETHDAARRSWVVSANAVDTDFPLQNLPFGVFRPRGSGEAGRIGVAVGHQILDVTAALEAKLLGGLSGATGAALRHASLNAFFGLASAERRATRQALFALLAEGSDAERVSTRGARLLYAQDSVDLLLPAAIGDYTDFYASVHHAQNVGSMFRPDNPLLPNYKWVPIGYHGRSSSIVASGASVRRPHGQTREDASAPPVFGPAKRMDYEVEIAFWIGEGNALARAVPIAEAGDQIAGLSLLNDWSARDMQTWEYQPLGPFLAKNFATTVSPWVVTADALAPFRAAVAPRPEGDPAPLPYLHDAADQARGAFDVVVELHLQSETMRLEGHAPMPVSRSHLKELYWSPAQLVAHHASNGCNLRPGDLLGSGTISGPTPESRACLLERAWRGTEPLALPSGEERKFLHDGDELTITAWAARPGYRTIGFGECRGRLTSS